MARKLLLFPFEKCTKMHYFAEKNFKKFSREGGTVPSPYPTRVGKGDTPFPDPTPSAPTAP